MNQPSSANPSRALQSFSDTVHVERRGRIGIIVVDHPPVNALNVAVRSGVLAAVGALAQDDAIDAIVLHCAGTTWVAGADLRAMIPPPVPSSTEVVRAIELSRKPVVAALHGNALGGGFEFALGSHARIALPATKLGAPEILIGLVPGAGGTQRLPRLIGVKQALEMILSGAPVDAQRALELGILDEIVSAEKKNAGADSHGPEVLLARACALATELAGRLAGKPPRRTSDLAVKLAPEDSVALERAVATRLPHGTELARVSAIEAVRASTELAFEDGLEREAALFAACRDSTESRALRHLFLAERDAAKLPAFSGETRAAANAGKAPVVERAAVIGGGTMGRGIALAFASARLPVFLLETDAAALERASKAIDDLINQSVAKGRLAADAGAARRALITGTLDRGCLKQVDLAIEAVFEDMGVKHDVFKAMDMLCPPHAILATNTSALDIDAIAAVTSRPAQVVGLHFFSPANVMRLVEVVRGAATAPDVLRASMEVVRRLRKLGVLSGNCDGFIGNRMLIGYRREAEFLLLEGSTPAQVDAALTRFGMAMGPFAVGDLAGLDIGAAGRARRRAAGTGPTDPRYGVIGDRLVERGALGQKTQRGYYRYEKGSRAPLENPETLALIRAESARFGIAPREIGDSEIVERCILPLINEGARIVEEGIALRPGDVDLVWVNGYGFPKLRGGPMNYADTLGLPSVLAAMQSLAQRHNPDDWTPAPLISRLVAERRTFDDLNREAAATRS